MLNKHNFSIQIDKAIITPRIFYMMILMIMMILSGCNNSSKAAVGFAYRRGHGTFSFRHCAGDGKTV